MLKKKCKDNYNHSISYNNISETIILPNNIELQLWTFKFLNTSIVMILKTMKRSLF